MGCSECDIEERTELYRKHLSKARLLQSVARSMNGLRIREDGCVENVRTGKVVNPSAFKYRALAEAKEKYNVEPERFVRRVIQKAM